MARGSIPEMTRESSGETSASASIEARRQARKLFGGMLRKLRQSARMSLDEASRREKIAKSTLQNWEAGMSCPKDFRQATKLMERYWDELKESQRRIAECFALGEEEAGMLSAMFSEARLRELSKRFAVAYVKCKRKVKVDDEVFINELFYDG